jgi:hypothetical protein
VVVVGQAVVVTEVLLVVLVLVEGGIVVEESRSSEQAVGAGADFRLRTVESFFTSSPPKMAQYRFESLPTVSAMPTCPVNGVGKLTSTPVQIAFTMFTFTSTTRHGSPGKPLPRNLKPLLPAGFPSGVQPLAGSEK